MVKASGFYREETQQHDFHKEEPKHYQQSTKSTSTWKWTPYNSKQTVHSGSYSSDKESPYSSEQKIGIYAMGLIIAAVLILCIGTFGSRNLQENKNSITTQQINSSESILNSNAVISSRSESRPTDAEIDTVSEAMEILKEREKVNSIALSEEVYMVYITDSGSKYHRQSCQYLAHSSYCVAISYAQNNGYEPCSRCHP